MKNKKLLILVLAVFLLGFSALLVKAEYTTSNTSIAIQNLIYRSVKPLLNIQKLSYQADGKTIKISTKEELEKFSNLVEKGSGNIIISGSEKITEGFIKDPSSKTVYYVYPGTQMMKRIMNEKAFRRLAKINDNQKINWDIVKKVSSASFNSLKNYQITDYSAYEFEYGAGDVVKGDIIKGSNSKVYFIPENGKKQWIQTETDFNKLKLDWKNLKVLSDIEIEKIDDDGTVEIEVSDDNPNTTDVQTIKISADGAQITWETDGYSTKGYKIVWSKNSQPTYPTRSGDKYQYFNNPNTNSASVYKFNDNSGTYYVRVCEYLGGTCGVYSNQIEIEL
jgi:hypothetical protein